MVSPIYSDDPGGGPGIAIPLGATRRYILLGIMAFLGFVGFLTTFLFQQISKRDNNLRQRGRYLITLQGYVGTSFVVLLFSYQAYKYRYPCSILYWSTHLGLVPFVLIFLGRAWRLITRIDRNIAIYQSQFAEPGDFDALGTPLPVYTSTAEGFINVDLDVNCNSCNDIDVNNNKEDAEDRRPNKHVDHSIVDISHDCNNNNDNNDLEQKEKVFELSHKTPEDIARLKKWYNRYRTATDRQILKSAIAYMFVTIVVASIFQLTNDGISIVPLCYNCHSGIKYIIPYFTMLVFAFGVSPFMIIQLKDFNDGFGIRNELFFISFMAVPCALCYFLIPPLDFRFSQVYLDKTTFMALLIITSHITSTIIPLYRHYKANKKPCPYTAWIMQRRALRKDKNRVEVLNGDAHPDDSYSSTTPVSPKLRDIKHNDNPQRNYTGRPASDVFQTLGDHVLSKNSTMDSNGQVGGGINMKSVSSKKADWEGFIRVLEDQKLFKKMSAFTVREFCAENTRFLYEVSRLERRARQYEHLRDLATNIDQQQQQQETAESNATSPRVSVIAPLPNQFSTAPPRIKKIISASSMSSTVPILQRTPSTEYDSEPSSPLGSSRSNFQTSSGSSSNTVSPSDLEQGTASVITEQKPRPSKISTSTPSFDPLPMPPTLLIQFEYIYKTFIVVGSRLELNLSHDTLQQIHRMARRGEWRSGMFDSAIFEIQELLFRDVWPKFVTSSQGLNYNGVKPTPESIQLQEVGVVNEQYARGVASSVSRVSLFMSSVPTSPVERSTPVMPSLPNAALPRTTTKTMPGPIQDIGMEGGFSLNMVDRSGSRTSVKTQGRNCNKDDAFNEELTQTGFKTWLRKTSRKGITAAAMISREGNNEESLGIIEQSRKSMGNRRSDISGLYSQSIQNSLANSGGGGGGGGGGY